MTKYYIGRQEFSGIERGDFLEFKKWIAPLKYVALDIETPVVDEVRQREVRLVQFSDSVKTYILQWSYLTAEEKLFIKQILEDKYIQKLIHYAQFECTTFMNYGISIENVWDTFLIESIFSTGYGWEAENDLKEVLRRYSLAELNKAYQTSFDQDEYVIEQIHYAAEDVIYLLPLRRMQIDRLRLQDDEWVAALENETVLGYSEIHWNGMLLDEDKWRELIKEATKIVEAAREELNDYLRPGGEFYDLALSLGYISSKDQITFSWRSPKIVKQLFSELLGIPGSSKAFVQGWLEEQESIDEQLLTVLEAYIAKDTIPLQNYLISNFSDYLLEKEYYTPANTVTINWGSPKQVLKIFNQVHPDLKSTAADILERVRNPHAVIKSYLKFTDKKILTTTFGEDFIRNNQHSDGYIRTILNQIIKTGRSSSRKPNMQQIPGDNPFDPDSIIPVYRNCFIEIPGRVYVDSDYASQELVIVAYLSGDPVWKEALRKGQDLHSVCAEVIYKQKWKDAADIDCAYYHQDKKKCKCKKHKPMRTAVKTINFGLIYGMQKYKLSNSLGITMKEAEDLINQYFVEFPLIKDFLRNLGLYGLMKGYIITPAPFFRKRYFPKWKSNFDNIGDFLAGDYIPALGSIQREAMNMPIQGGAADMVKLAVCMIRWFIRDNGLQDNIRIVAVVHDQITTTCTEDIAEWWKHHMDRIMREAAIVIVKDGSLGCETTISPVWTK